MRVALSACVLFAVASFLTAADDPVFGTWRLNVEKSKYSPGPPPKSATVTYEESDGGVKRSGETVDAKGERTNMTYTAKYDGKDYPVTGFPLGDTIAFKRVNTNTVEATLKKDGKPVTSARRQISKDGKTMTITIKGKNAEGQTVHNVTVYEKQ